ncbi:hypothetical protein GGR50DRAFT_698983 [Xylaria sp. CBS 124048]|nr:hypothetical protein GGR50DRAFT_698983 [Xylaria sp. CBS 124048]
MWHSYQAVVTYLQQLSEKNRQDVESLRDQYTPMQDGHAALVHLQQSSVGATENMLSQFHRQIEKISNKFASNIYGAIAQFASDNKARDEAFQQISAITQRQQQRIEALEHNAGEEQEFRQNATHWAETKESQINGLFAGEVIDPAQIDARMQEQLPDIRTFATDAINEFRTQLREKGSADAQTVINNLQRLLSLVPVLSHLQPLWVNQSPAPLELCPLAPVAPQPNTPALLFSGKIFEHSLFQAALASNRDELVTPMMSGGNGAPARGPTS